MRGWRRERVTRVEAKPHSVSQADAPLLHLSCGYVGFSDGWQDLNRHKALTYAFTHADDGSVSLSAEAQGRSGVLALGFAKTPKGARTLAATALVDKFDDLREEFLRGWRSWGDKLKLPRPTAVLGDAGLFSAAVLKIHEDRSYPGAVVASLSVPWGNTTDTLGGYHLVWPRDAILSAFALLGAEQTTDVRRMLGHLMAVQTREGHWPQNYFPSGESFWTGIQLDEARLSSINSLPNCGNSGCRTCPAPLRWFEPLSDSSCELDLAVSRIAGKRIPASIPLPCP